MSEVSKSIEHLQSAHSADVDQLVKTLDSLQGLTTARREQREREIEQEKVAAKQNSDKLEQSIREKHSAVQREMEVLVALSVSHAAKIASELSAAKEQNATFLAEVESKLSRSRAEMTQFLSEQSQNLLELQASIDESIDEQTKQLQANKTSLVSALRDAHEKQQQELDEMKRHLTQYVDKCVATQAEKLQEQTLFIEKNVSEQEHELQVVRNAAEREILTSVKALSSQNATQEAHSVELQEQVVAMRTQVSDASSRHDKLIKASVGEQKQSIEKMAQIESAASKELLEVVAKQSVSNAALIENRQASSSDFIAKHDGIRSTLSSGHASLQTELRANAGATKRKFESVSQSAGAVIQESTQEATLRRHELETYMKKRKVWSSSVCGSASVVSCLLTLECWNDAQIDKETGTTPKKKSFSFPSFLATKVSLELPAEDEVGGQAFSTASQSSTASTSSVHSNESDEDPVESSSVAPRKDTNAEPISAKPAPPTPSGIGRLGVRAGVSGVTNASKLKPAPSGVDRKLKFGSKPVSSIQAPRKFR